jgi:hypothetical protein
MKPSDMIVETAMSRLRASVLDSHELDAKVEASAFILSLTLGYLDQLHAAGLIPLPKFDEAPKAQAPTEARRGRTGRPTSSRI